MISPVRLCDECLQKVTRKGQQCAKLVDRVAQCEAFVCMVQAPRGMNRTCPPGKSGRWRTMSDVFDRIVINDATEHTMDLIYQTTHTALLGTLGKDAPRPQNAADGFERITSLLQWCDEYISSASDYTPTGRWPDHSQLKIMRHLSSAYAAYMRGRLLTYSTEEVAVAYANLRSAAATIDAARREARLDVFKLFEQGVDEPVGVVHLCCVDQDHKVDENWACDIRMRLVETALLLASTRPGSSAVMEKLCATADSLQGVLCDKASSVKRKVAEYKQADVDYGAVEVVAVQDVTVPYATADAIHKDMIRVVTAGQLRSVEAAARAAHLQGRTLHDIISDIGPGTE